MAFMKSIQNPNKAPPDKVSQQKANDICQMINHARSVLLEMFENSSVDMSAEKSKEENEWGAENSQEKSSGDLGENMGMDGDLVLEKMMDMILMKVKVM